MLGRVMSKHHRSGQSPLRRRTLGVEVLETRCLLNGNQVFSAPNVHNPPESAFVAGEIRDSVDFDQRTHQKVIVPAVHDTPTDPQNRESQIRTALESPSAEGAEHQPRTVPDSARPPEMHSGQLPGVHETGRNSIASGAVETPE